jgi:carbon storage regulator
MSEARCVWRRGGWEPRRVPVLVLTRKVNESITIGSDITVSVVEIKGNQIKLGIEAPRHTTVHRTEVFESIVRENVKAARTPVDLDGIYRYFLPK